MSEIRSGSDGWPLWEIFVRSARGLAHKHVGSLHAADGEMALESARNAYTRRGEGTSIWVARSSDILVDATACGDRSPEAAGDKAFRHATYYRVPEGVKNI